jgi:hypothetical protein
LEDLEDYLRQARILDVGEFAEHGGHKSFRFILEGGVGALAKPAHTAPGPDASWVVRYEVAGWMVARDLGWTDLVATTVLRETDLFPGHTALVETSVQVLWPSFDRVADPSQFEDHDLWRAALIDRLILHTDRAHNNWGAVPGHGRPRLKLIDHGLAFGTAGAANSTFVEAKRGQEVPGEIRHEISEFLDHCEESELRDFLPDSGLKALLDRGRLIVETGVLENS